VSERKGFKKNGIGNDGHGLWDKGAHRNRQNNSLPGCFNVGSIDRCTRRNQMAALGVASDETGSTVREEAESRGKQRWVYRIFGVEDSVAAAFGRPFFFCERGIWIKMKHSTNLPFYKEHPEIREKHTHILGSFHRHLPRWRHQPSSSAQCCPPPAAPRDTKTLEMPQELAPQTNHDALFPLNDHRPSRRQGKEMNNQSNATSRTNHPSVLITSAAKEKNPTKALTSQSNRRHHRR
jgi:hypothetical protein